MKTFDDSKTYLQTKTVNGSIHEAVVYTEIAKLYNVAQRVWKWNEHLQIEVEHYKDLMHWHGKIMPINPPADTETTIQDIYKTYNDLFRGLENSYEDPFKYQWYRVIGGDIKEWTVTKYTCAEMDVEPYNTQNWFKAEGTRELPSDKEVLLHQKIEQHLLEQMDCPAVATHEEVVTRINKKYAFDDLFNEQKEQIEKIINSFESLLSDFVDQSEVINTQNKIIENNETRLAVDEFITRMVKFQMEISDMIVDLKHSKNLDIRVGLLL